MRVVNPDAEVLDPHKLSVYEFVELAGRTCYKSEDSITPGSAVSFVQRLLKNGHRAMLEHGILYIADKEFGNIYEPLDIRGDYLFECLGRCPYINVFGPYISGSLRAFLEYKEQNSKDMSIEESALFYALSLKYPEIFGNADDFLKTYVVKAGAYDKNAFHIRNLSSRYCLLSYSEFEDVCSHGDQKLADTLLYHAVKFTTDRGVTHELVRHRTASFAQESTRYCSYDKGKFGHEITVVAPAWHILDSDSELENGLYNTWTTSCEYAEMAYFAMLDAGATAQQARAVLPQSTKADIVVTATEKEWRHIFDLRLFGTTGVPHPDIKFVMHIAAEQLAEATHKRFDPVQDYLIVHEKNKVPFSEDFRKEEEKC